MEEQKVQEVQTAQENETVTKKGREYIVVKIPRTNKKYLVRTPISNNALEDMAKLLIPSKENVADAVIEDAKIASKAAAIYLTPGYFKRKLTYWLRWRWFYYIKQYDCDQLQPILSAGNASTPYLDFLRMMSILANQKTTQMHMTVQEAEKFMREISQRSQKTNGGDVDRES